MTRLMHLSCTSLFAHFWFILSVAFVIVVALEIGMGCFFMEPSFIVDDSVMILQCVLHCKIVSIYVVQKRWAQKEKEMRDQMKKLKSGPSTSEYSSFHGKCHLEMK